jgi:hypothetical protein
MTLGLFSLDGWKIILARQQRAQVLEAAGTRQWSAVVRLLDEIRGSAPLATLTKPWLLPSSSNGWASVKSARTRWITLPTPVTAGWF